jgi:DNA repair photolyase
MPFLKVLDEMGIHYYFQYTLNDYEKEGIEPKEPAIEKRIETFKELSLLIGKEKVIWRFDPIIVTQQLSTRDILKKIWNIGNQLKEYTDKLVISFIDVNEYRKVQRNLVKENSLFTKETIANSELTKVQMNEIGEGLMKIGKRWKDEGRDITISTCAEKIDLEQYDIRHNRCIDGELMKTIFIKDAELAYYLNFGKLPENNTLFPDEYKNCTLLSAEKLKDKGQRKICGCMVSKDIGMYNTCSHFCAYCYANTSQENVIKNRKLHTEDNECMINFTKGTQLSSPPKLKIQLGGGSHTT